MRIPLSTPTLSSLLVVGLLARVGAAQDQFQFSVNWHSQSLAVTASGGPNQINEGDVLSFGPGAPDFGPLQAPTKAISGDQLGLVRYGICLDHQPETPCGIEIDALSEGTDHLLQPNLASSSGGLKDAGDFWISTDEFAIGLPTAGAGPTVFTEGAGQSAVFEASADIMVVYALGTGPIGPGGPAARHVGAFDGNGLPSGSGALYVGMGLIEPNVPGQGQPAGDDLDSLNIGGSLGFPSTGMYLSFDAGFIDPLTNGPNSGTAGFQGVSAAAVVFVAAPGATPVPYASAASLGLDIAGEDDLDALVLAENGVSGFQPSMIPYDWTSGDTDMLLFSVRRGSAVIGLPDSIFGEPIEAGDILTTPRPSSMGGQSPFPGILFSAESLGLATMRSHGASNLGDDLNAMDLASAPCFDCNNNGVEDVVDIDTGGSADTNGNGIPDECERINKFCECPASSAPCSNANSEAGCANSATAGAYLYYGSGNFKVSDDNLVLTTTGVPPNKFGLLYMGGAQISTPLADGVRCVDGGSQGIYRYGVQNSGPGGVLNIGPGIVADSCANFPSSGCIGAGDKWNFQAWYRDTSGPCGGGFNFSNGIEVGFLP